MKPLYLETNRLLLRRFTTGDVTDVFNYAGDEGVMRYIQPPFTFTEAGDFVQRFGCGDKPLIYALCRKPQADGEEPHPAPVIGHVIFHPHEREDIYELGFVIGGPWQRMGYAYEIGREIVGYAFKTSHLHKLVAETVEGNEASVHTLRKLGLRQEGVLRKQVFHEGEWLDEYRFGMLDSEYPLLY